MSSHKRSSVNGIKKSDNRHQRSLDSMDNLRNGNKSHGNHHGMFKNGNGSNENSRNGNSRNERKGRSGKSNETHHGNRVDSHKAVSKYGRSDDTRTSRNSDKSGQSRRVSRCSSVNSQESAFQEFRRSHKVNDSQRLDSILCVRDGMNFAETNKAINYRTDLDGSYLGPDLTNFPSKEKDLETNGFEPYMSLHGTNGHKNGQRFARDIKLGARDEKSHNYNLSFDKMDFDLDQIRNREYHVYTVASQNEQKGDYSKHFTNGADKSHAHVSEKDGIYKMPQKESVKSSFERPRAKSDLEYGHLDVMFKHVKNDHFQMVLVADEMKERRKRDQEINTRTNRSVDNVTQQNRTSIHDRESRVQMLEHKEMVRFW
ncbi:probable cyclin-dependent serine/threonine-protein kinase DDB_G0292550 [Mercenaria mercenaria]|uniref:probable cyclin-dependent serine/threonine-protein kinase DDB_G0292550 n=1 Tax=Mercenaria mercenaria TaxID=6596 RepID=UPI00234EED53|nr:probable cyclin-dependent serine/threonine-protein kinase DDB_G0292550 [Mercenaria mercenaria]